MTDVVQFDEILEWSPEIDKIAPALAKAQGAFMPIAKNEEGKVDTDRAKYSYKYADLASVLAATVPALNANGIFFSQPSAIAGFKATCVTMLLHESGQWVRSRLTITSKGDDAQKLGGALTYARRYAANGILGVCPNEDDDGKGASTRDDRDDVIATIQADFAEYRSAAAATAKRMTARSTPAEWQAATARSISSDRTANWAELSVPEMLAFFRAIPAPPETLEKPPEDAPASAATQLEPEPLPEPVQGDSEADAAEKKRLDYVAWIEPRLAHLNLPESEIQDYVGAIRNRTLDADPSADLSITYDWRELRERELRDFYAMVPKKARATAGAA